MTGMGTGIRKEGKGKRKFHKQFKVGQGNYLLSRKRVGQFNDKGMRNWGWGERMGGMRRWID